MERIIGDLNSETVQKISSRLPIYRVRWDFNDTNLEENTVSFVEVEFKKTPTPADIERVISESGIEARRSELEEMASLLGYEYDAFEKEMATAKTNRIASDPIAQILEITRQNRLNQTEVTDEEALSYPNTFLTFEELCKKGQQVAQGVVFRYENKLWRVVKSHTPQSIYPPSTNTASLYSRIDKKHAGTIDDPIPYEQLMVLELGKYYTQYGVLYECIQATNVGLPYDLKDMVANVKVVEI